MKINWQSWTLWAIKIAAVLEVLPNIINWADTNFGWHLAVNAIVIQVLSISALLVAWIRHNNLKNEVK